MTRGRLIVGLTAAILIGIVAYFAWRSGSGTAVGSRVPPLVFAVPALPWEGVEPTREAVVRDDCSVALDEWTLAPPLPPEVTDACDLQETRDGLVAEWGGSDGPAHAQWRFARFNPHTQFAASWRSTVGALRESPPVSTLELPAGDVFVPNRAYTLAPLPEGEAVVPLLAGGPVVWRNGRDTVTLSQATADLVRVRKLEDGGVVIELHWWRWANKNLPEGCPGLDEREVTVDAAVVIGFARDVPIFRSRLPAGAAGAAVPVFFDPASLDDPRFADGAAASSDDFAARALTVALGHSDRSDARYGNGGLAGTGVGGSILVPASYPADDEAVSRLDAALEETTVEVLPEASVLPSTCDDWIATLGERPGALEEPLDFDGAAPNILESSAWADAPASAWGTLTWPVVRLSGRRKDVVQQTLSRTYLERLDRSRGIAVILIPLIASRNPLVPAAAEGLLDPERRGHWTLGEAFARALADIELLSEERAFALLGVDELSAHLNAVFDVRMAREPDGSVTLRHERAEAIEGFTLVVEGTVVPTTSAVELEYDVREGPGRHEQTWVWFDLPADEEVTLRFERPEPFQPQSIAWSRETR